MDAVVGAILLATAFHGADGKRHGATQQTVDHHSDQWTNDNGKEHIAATGCPEDVREQEEKWYVHRLLEEEGNRLDPKETWHGREKDRAKIQDRLEHQRPTRYKRKPVDRLHNIILFAPTLPLKVRAFASYLAAACWA